jgi:transposase InsO family protein
MCQVLEVSISGYYAWRTRPLSQHAREDGHLCELITQIFQTHRGLYGSPRVHAELRDLGIHCARKRVVRLMQSLGLHVSLRPHHVHTTQRQQGVRVAENVLNREFGASDPNRKWVVDITDIWTAEGWLYLAVVLDLCSRMIVGWSMSTTHDEALVEAALRMALARRTPRKDLLHHSDQGSEYTSQAYLGLLEQLGIQVSMSRVANCYDNAAMESFFSTLKKECVYRIHLQSRQQARQVIFEYIEGYYNRVRRHSTLGYLSPWEFEHRLI